MSDPGRINGAPIWIRRLDVSGAERTAVKEAPGVDGAVVELLGQAPESLSIVFELIRDGEHITADAETAWFDLRFALLGGGPYEVEVPVYGVLSGLYQDGGWSLTVYDDEREGVISGQIAFVDVDPFPILQESTVGAVESAVGAVARSARADLVRRAPDAGWRDRAVDRVNAAANWLSRTQGRISSSLPGASDFASALSRFTSETLLQTPAVFGRDFQELALSIASLIPSISSEQDGSAFVSSSAGEPGAAAATLVSVLEDGAAFDSGLPAPPADLLGAEASIEDLDEREQIRVIAELVLSTVLASVCFAAISTEYGTANAVVDLDAALAPAFQVLFDLPGVDYGVYRDAAYLLASTRRHLADEAASLPRLVPYTVPEDTDLLALVAELYQGQIQGVDEVQVKADEIAIVNRLREPTEIRQGAMILILRARGAAV